MIGEAVTVLPRVVVGVDRYGHDLYDWPLPGFDVPGVLVAPGKSTEGNEAIRQEVDTACTLYRLPYGIDIGPTARVIVRDETWFVSGNPARWSNGDWMPGAVLELSRTEG